MLIAAFDPGINASAALLSYGEGGSAPTRFLDMVDLPTIADGEKRQLDCAWIGSMLERWEPDIAVVENVQPMPSIPGSDGERRSMGAASAFRFGLSVGMIRGVLMAYQVPVELLHPQSWKRHFGLKGPDKAKGVVLLKTLRPEVAEFITLVKHHGRADAGLMALCYAEKRGML